MPIIIPANSAVGGGFDVANSLRFNSGSSDYLNRTFGTPTSSQTWTLSFWIKRCKIGSATEFVFNTDGGNEEDRLQFSSSDTLTWFEQNSGGGTVAELTTSQKFRDVSAWYHIVVARDSTQGTSSNRIKLYVNGSQVTALGTATYPSQNDSSRWNTAVAHEIGARNGGTFVNLYMSEVVFIDGQQLAPTSFGEFDEDSGIWKPIDVSGLTFGNNGFYLDFENSGNLGADASGESHNWTANNFTAIDQSTDTCTNNFSTLNPLIGSNHITLSEGNLYASSGASSWASESSTFSLSQGKWYLEDYVVGYNHNALGVQYSENATNRVAAYPFEIAGGYGFKFYSGTKTSAGGDSVSYGNAVSNGQTVGMALDLDNHKIYWSINGTWQNSGNPESGATGTGSAFDLPTGKDYVIVNALNTQSGGAISSFNFGSPPHSISSGNADGNGYGNFEYAVPSGYYSLNTKNLAEYG